MANLYYKSGNDWLPLGGGSLPVGSYVYSDNNTSPASEMGGTWQALGYTAIEPVILFETKNYFIGFLIRYYNIVCGQVFTRMGGALDDITSDAPHSNVFANSTSSSYYYYGQKISQLGQKEIFQGTSHNFPGFDREDTLFIHYTTDESLSTNVKGGKYLFKRTA